MKNQIQTMFQLQDTLNNNTNGTDWKRGITKEGKVISWERAIYLECAELIESYPWKHWKDISAQPDFNNARIEVVDIWHFLMSLILELSLNERISLQKAKENVLNQASKIQPQEDKTWSLEQNKQLNAFLKDFETLIRLSIKMQIVKEKFEEEKFEKIITQMIETYFQICSKTGLSFDKMYQLYIGKNLLNQFRQDHGYKEGTYKKMWGDEEDNVVMTRIIQQNPTDTYDELYSKLKKVYIEVCINNITK